jgi:hypothetical protein
MNPADIHTCTPQVPADPYASKADTQELIRIGKLPAALRLAELLEKTIQWPLHGKAADELRRLHAIEQTQPAPVQEPVGYEKYSAIREGHRNASEDAYFAARPAHDNDISRVIFRHGFDRGYDAPPAQEFTCSTGLCHYKAAPVQEPVGRTDQQIVDQTEELAVWLLSWRFNHQPETDTPMRRSTHPFAERCWAAACHIQEMLTATDPENAVAELDVAPEKGGAA